jgi:16S rRNA (uracil1498-N3)-methyltransferase
MTDTHTDPRLFTANPLVLGTPVPATPAQAHYLGRVLRRGVGDRVRLFNGRDGEFGARIEALRKDQASFLPDRQIRPQTSPAALCLVFAALKRDATDLVVQKATELGVTELRPIFTARTNIARLNADRLSAIAMEAAEQSERLTVPAIHAPQHLFDLLAAWPPDRMVHAAIERAEAPPPGPLANTLLIGPEGGFAPAELDALHDKPFITPVSLGRLVLRAETAAIAGLALIALPGR